MKGFFMPIKTKKFLDNLLDWFKDVTLFAKEFTQHPTTLGTPFICSSFAAEEILKFVNPVDSSPRNYLEVGAGTGIITRYMVEKLRPIDHLDVVEIDLALYELLKKKFSQHNNVSIYHSAIQDWKSPSNIKYDVIVSAVPLNSLPSVQVLESIFSAFKRLIKPNGIFSSLEYVGTTTLSKLFFKSRTSENFNSFKQNFFKQAFETNIVFLNIPPARIMHCKIQKQD